MQSFCIDFQTIEQGKSSYHHYRAAALSGRRSGFAWEVSYGRHTGPECIVGAALAANADGIYWSGDVISTVARVTECKRDAVASLMYALSGSDCAKHIWHFDDDEFSFSILHGSQILSGEVKPTIFM